MTHPFPSPPSPRSLICLLFALAGCHITSFCTICATYPLYTLPPLNTPAGCSIASCCAAFATHPLDVPPSLNTLTGCSIASNCTAIAAHALSAFLPLNMPYPPSASCLQFVCPGWLSHCFSSCRLHLSPSQCAAASQSAGRLSHCLLLRCHCHPSS
jgi:hypothetical protein